MKEGLALGRRHLRRGLGVAAAAGLLAALLFADTAATQLTGSSCTNGEQKTIEVGIVKAIGCWTQSTNSNNQTIYTARWEDQSAGIDLNGFILTGSKGGGLQINGTTREVTSVALTTNADDRAQLSSRNWPFPGQNQAMGSPIKLDFIAPQNSALLLETLHLGSNTVANALAGLSPVGTIETPVRLEEDGTGSMDLTVALAGIFTLKDKPQSVTISLPTSSGEGTKLDGFEIKLQEIDAVNFLKINDFEAKYSASRKVIAGGANLSFPFTGGKGFGGSFELDNGVLTKLSISVHGTKIPIGAVGFLTDISGGFSFNPVQALNFDKYCKSQGYEDGRIVGPDHGTNAYANWKCHKGNTNAGVDVGKACQLQTGNSGTTARAIDLSSAYSWQCIGGITSGATSFDLEATANFGADIGAAVPTPFGNIEPVRVDAGLAIGYAAGGLIIDIHGGLELFRLPIGDAYLIINTNAGVAFGAGVGIGLPSFRNNPSDPFYLGLRLDGWVARGHYQFSGDGQFSLFGVHLLQGNGLINDRAIGACWHVLGVPGGAVFRYGDVVRTFGVTCGLDDYREQFPGASAAAAGRARKFDLGAERHVLAVKGAGAAPRFTLRRRDGFTVRTPTDKLAELTGDHFIVINEFTDITNVVLKDPRGRWKVIPDHDSAPIISLKAAREAPKERVKARIEGRGHTRTLVWDSLNRPHTRLVFTELLPGGQEVPILQTGRASGSKRFKVTHGSNYGKRRLRVTIIHGFGSRQKGVVDHYTVNPPGKRPAPKKVSAWRQGHDVFVRWSGVKGAHGYLVEVTTAAANGDPRASNYVRKVSAKKRSVVIPHHPDGKKAVAKVYALNLDDKPGRRAKRAFKTSPPPMKLGKAARRSAKSAEVRGGGVALRTECPQDGHCQVEVELRRGGKQIRRTSYQQAPDTFHFLRLKGRGEDLQIVVTFARTGEQAKAKARPKG